MFLFLEEGQQETDQLEDWSDDTSVDGRVSRGGRRGIFVTLSQSASDILDLSVVTVSSGERVITSPSVGEEFQLGGGESLDIGEDVPVDKLGAWWSGQGTLVTDRVGTGWENISQTGLSGVLVQIAVGGGGTKTGQEIVSITVLEVDSDNSVGPWVVTIIVREGMDDMHLQWILLSVNVMLGRSVEMELSDSVVHLLLVDVGEEHVSEAVSLVSRANPSVSVIGASHSNIVSLVVTGVNTLVNESVWNIGENIDWGLLLSVSAETIFPIGT